MCGRGGTGRRAALRSLWPKGRGSSSLLDRTNCSYSHFSPFKVRRFHTSSHIQANQESYDKEVDRPTSSASKLTEAMKPGPSRLDLVGDGPDLPFRHLGREQLGEDRHGGIEGRGTLRDEIAHRLGHAVHLEAWRMTRLPQVIIAADVGERLLGKAQDLRRVDRRCWRHLAVGQPMQDVEHMELGRNAGLQRQLGGAKHRLLVMVQQQRQDLDHLPIATWPLEQVPLHLAEPIGHLGERCAVPEGAKLALDDRQIVPPVVARSPRLRRSRSSGLEAAGEVQRRCKTRWHGRYDGTSLNVRIGGREGNGGYTGSTCRYPTSAVPRLAPEQGRLTPTRLMQHSPLGT